MKQISRMVLGITLLWFAMSSRAQVPGGPPSDLTAQIDKIFEKWNRTDSPGCALSLMKDGRIVTSTATEWRIL